MQVECSLFLAIFCEWKGESSLEVWVGLKTELPSENNYLNRGGRMAAKVILDNISVRNNPALFQENIEL